jgi:hypothetical protein
MHARVAHRVQCCISPCPPTPSHTAGRRTRQPSLHVAAAAPAAAAALASSAEGLTVSSRRRRCSSSSLVAVGCLLMA